MLPNMVYDLQKPDSLRRQHKHLPGPARVFLILRGIGVKMAQLEPDA
jgi:hypothetical protein